MFVAPMDAIGWGSHIPPDGSYNVKYSCIFNDDDTAYLTRTQDTGDSKRIATFSWWMKRCTFGSEQAVIAAAPSGRFFARFTTADKLALRLTNGTDENEETTIIRFRDATAWYHCVWRIDVTQSTSTDRSRFYVNGSEVALDNSDPPAQNTDVVGLGDGTTQRIGMLAHASASKYDGYLAEFIYVDNQSLDASSFGELSSNGIWVPKEYEGAYGTNGFHIPFSNPSSVGADTSGNGNNFTAVSLGFNNVVADSITNDATGEVLLYPALNPLTKNSSVNLTNENLTHTGTNGSIDTNTKVNHPLPATGKFYFEFVAGSSSGVYLGVVVGSCANNESGNGANKGFLYYQANGKLYANPITAGSGDAYGDTWTTNDVIGVAIDMTNGGDLWFSKNGTWQSSATAGEIAAGTTTNAAVTNMPTNTTNSRTYDDSGLYVAIGDSSASGTGTLRFAETSWTGTAPTGFGELTTTVTGIGNRPVFNANIAQSARNTNTLANGNLHWGGGGGDGIAGTHSFGTSGKWYWEQTAGDDDSYVLHGIISKSVYNSNDMAENTGASGFDTIGGDGEAFAWYRGNKWEKTTIVSSYGTATSSASDVVMLALDIDNNKIWYGVNGTWIASGDPAAGSNASSTITSGIEWYPYAGSFTGDPVVNFGQKAFAYPIPTGFSALSTASMATPAIKKPTSYFDVVTYAGTGSELAISSLSFQPDFVWIKNRDQTDSHMLYDVCRGATKEIHSDTNDVETTTAQTLKSFDSAGFTLGTDVQVNTNTEDYVAWCWKAGGSPSSNGDGSITTSVSVNTDAGFSIGTYTADGGNDTLGHGLSAAPEFVLVKKRASGVGGWRVYHAEMALGGYGTTDAHTDYMELHTDAIPADDATIWNDTAPTSSVISIGSDQNVSPNTYVFYAWHSVAGFSKFGSYNGNGAADGPHVYLGFEPALVIVKKAEHATNNWNMLDHKRHPFNDGDAPYIYADTNAAETNPGDSSQDVDILANGFKIRNSNAGYNTSTRKYIYAAWAKSPFALNNRAR
tara:strand:+ start:7984 stop:11049 length:3066 start_codon:yes stop_codon:yes gene_type:complete